MRTEHVWSDVHLERGYNICSHMLSWWVVYVYSRYSQRIGLACTCVVRLVFFRQLLHVFNQL